MPHILLSGKDEILDALTQIIFLEPSYKLYNEIDDAYNTPWSLYYDLTAARFQSERLYLDFGLGINGPMRSFDRPDVRSLDK